jgi:hypothetical protein
LAFVTGKEKSWSGRITIIVGTQTVHPRQSIASRSQHGLVRDAELIAAWPLELSCAIAEAHGSILEETAACVVKPTVMTNARNSAVIRKKTEFFGIYDLTVVREHVS